MVEISLEMMVALGRLAPRDREVVIDRVVVGQTLQAVGDRLGFSKERARQIEGMAGGSLDL